MTERALSLDEFLDAIRPELEHQVDEMILAHPAQDRRVLMAHRELILDRLVTATRIRNLEHKLANAEARLRPRLVHEQ